MNTNKNPYVCPSGLSGSLDNSLRRWLQNPETILKPFIKGGMTVLDLGCGPGVFTIEIARLLNGFGKVIAADLQEEMLRIISHKIGGTDLEKIVELHNCQKNTIDLIEKADFILAFWMVHEVPDHERLFSELKILLKPGGKILIAEPKMHVTGKAFQAMMDVIRNAGFEVIDRPKIFFSRSVVLRHEA
jgi:ubiquinone/menaquinone biosynthesis C-methylase UbiE